MASLTSAGTSHDVAANKRRAAALVATVVAVVVLLALVLELLLPTRGLVLVAGVVVAGGLAALAVVRAEGMALRLAGAEPADEATWPRLHNVTDGLSAGSGVPKPALYVVRDPAPNVLAAGLGPRRSSVVVTTGLLERLTRVELEAALAHALSHVKSYDVRVGTLAVPLLGVPGRAGPLAPLARRALDAVLDPWRLVHADLDGVSITRYPPGMVGALEKVGAESAQVGSGASPVAHLWLVPPAGASRHEPLDDRLAILREL